MLFIDCSNFYHSLKEQNDLPFDADQFALLMGELDNHFDLIGIKFYDAIKNRIKDPVGYSKQQRFHARLQKAVPKIEIKCLKLRYITSISKEEVLDAAKIIGLPVSLGDKLYLLLKKLGVVKIAREKGLDVLLVIDALQTHKNSKDTHIIILSGDSDFVPAVRLMRSEGATVINLHTYSGSSKELREACSEHIQLDVDMGKVILKRYPKKLDNAPSL
jgi:uncharacterized LabA/DUF88 family protein